jgi:hypothetical protein
VSILLPNVSAFADLGIRALARDLGRAIYAVVGGIGGRDRQDAEFAAGPSKSWRFAS